MAEFDLKEFGMFDKQGLKVREPKKMDVVNVFFEKRQVGVGDLNRESQRC